MSLSITLERRAGWDVFVFLVIVFVAFEIPYDLLVGWSNSSTNFIVSSFVLAVFLLDMLLNCFTVSEKSYGGFWGWRHVAGLFYAKLTPKILRQDHPREEYLITEQPGIFLSYIKSGWFLIDFLAVFPFQFLFQNLSFFGLSRTIRLVRLSRFLRIIRSARLIKTARIFSILNSLFMHRPAIRRFIILAILVPWIAHIHACLFYRLEVGSNSNSISTYGDALHHIFFAFIASDPEAKSYTTAGDLISISAVVLGLIFVGILIGNFAALFEQIDSERAIYEEKVKEWDNLFSSYKGLFDKELQLEILSYVKQKSSRKASLENHAEMIRSLDSTLEEKIKKKVFEIRKECHHLPNEAELAECLEETK
jgi:hypothetical protein